MRVLRNDGNDARAALPAAEPRRRPAWDDSRNDSAGAVLPGKHLGVELYPFEGRLVVTQFPALTAQHPLPVLSNLIALGFHAPKERLGHFLFAIFSKTPLKTLRHPVPPF